MDPNPDLSEALFASASIVPRLSAVTDSLGLRLLRACVLRPYCQAGGATDVTQASWLQQQLRQQFFRLMRQYPEARLRYTYQMNCPPVGLRMRPQSRVCNHPVVCPWCLIRRRAQPAYEELINVPTLVREPLKVLLWRRVGPLNSRFIFFPVYQGPHTLCRSATTIQLGTPVGEAEHQLSMRVTGIQLVPKDFDVKSVLSCPSIQPKLTLKEYPDAADTTIFDAVVQACAYDCRVPLAEANLATFHTLAHYHNTHAKTRLYRVSKYKPQGDPDGHQQPTVSEEQHQPSAALSLFD